MCTALDSQQQQNTDLISMCTTQSIPLFTKQTNINGELLRNYFHVQNAPIKKSELLHSLFHTFIIIGKVIPQQLHAQFGHAQ